MVKIVDNQNNINWNWILWQKPVRWWRKWQGMATQMDGIYRRVCR